MTEKPTWEMTPKRVERAFFAAHTVTELMEWADFALEDAGRLTEPMRYEATSDKHVPISWDEAFALSGRHLRSRTVRIRPPSTLQVVSATRRHSSISWRRPDCARQPVD